MRGDERLRAGVDVDEAARADRHLTVAHVEAALAKQRRLLVCDDGPNRYGRAEEPRQRAPKIAARGPHLQPS